MPTPAARQTWRHAAIALVVAALTSTGLVAATAASGPAVSRDQLTNFGFDAMAFGSQTTGSPTADSGRTALSVLPCTRFVPRRVRNFDASTTDGAGTQLRNVETINQTRAAEGRTEVTSLVTAESGELGGGDIEFNNLRGRVLSYHNSTGYHVVTTSSVGSLSVQGVPVPVQANEELEIPVPGSGTLFVNRRDSSASNKAATGVVNVLKYVRDDGTIEKAGRAFTRMDGEVEGGVFGGGAWGSESKRADGTSLGRSALQPMPCPGTDGEVIDTRTARGSTDGGFIGARRSAARGAQGAKGAARGYTLAVIDRAGFGVLEFRNIRARANVVRQLDGDVQRDAEGTGVGQVLVAGEPVENPPPGERQEVAGVGEYVVRIVEKSRTAVDVTAVRVRLYNGTPANRSDDTIYDLGRARLGIKRG